MSRAQREDVGMFATTLRKPYRLVLGTLVLTAVVGVGSAARAQQGSGGTGGWDRGRAATPASHTSLDELSRWVESQGFGSGFQWTTISAAGFAPLFGFQSFQHHFLEGSILQAGTGVGSQVAFGTALVLPNGAVIEALCMISEDLDNDGENALILSATEFDPTPERVGGNVVSTGSAEQPGWASHCANDLGIAYRSRADFNGNSVVGDVMYWLELDMTGGNAVKKFGGAVVLWRRTMSPPPATPTFNDVPTNHPFYQHIEAIAASGITEGCADPNNFCPNGVLTRAQIVALLSEALGLHWPN